MNLIPRWNWLQQMAGRTDTTAADADAADMGTAFGLDASFRDEPEAPAQELPGAATHCVSRLTGLPRT